MPLDQQSKAVVERLASIPLPPFDQLTAEYLRQEYSNLATMAGPPANSDLVCEDRIIPGSPGQIKIRTYRPSLEDRLPACFRYCGLAH